ncbi:MAG: hypothetical protein JWP35_3512 [Caulobacter sp.]|nr:hypothetical protein [Caulobacter sp.]
MNALLKDADELAGAISRAVAVLTPAATQHLRRADRAGEFWCPAQAVFDELTEAHLVTSISGTRWVALTAQGEAARTAIVGLEA